MKKIFLFAIVSSLTMGAMATDHGKLKHNSKANHKVCSPDCKKKGC